MVADPGQHKNVASQHPTVSARLGNAVNDWKADVMSALQKEDRPFLIGHADYKCTQIPARDGTPHGSIKRSNRFPNCSFFTGWTSVDDKVTWDAEVAADGDYEVEIHYTCPKADVGSTIELSLNDARLTGRITESHDPPIRGAEHDRVPRKESLVKDFKSLSLGTVRLEKGRGELTLRATKIPGSQAMEFRLIMFTRLK